MQHPFINVDVCIVSKKIWMIGVHIDLKHFDEDIYGLVVGYG